MFSVNDVSLLFLDRSPCQSDHMTDVESRFKILLLVNVVFCVYAIYKLAAAVVQLIHVEERTSRYTTWKVLQSGQQGCLLRKVFEEFSMYQPRNSWFVLGPKINLWKNKWWTKKDFLRLFAWKKKYKKAIFISQSDFSSNQGLYNYVFYPIRFYLKVVVLLLTVSKSNKSVIKGWNVLRRFDLRFEILAMVCKAYQQ